VSGAVTGARDFSWQSALEDRERASLAYAEPGTMLDDGDWYIDATSPKRGPVLAMEGEQVPKGGLYILRSSLASDALWERLQLAARGTL
jgi:hypothetical protein